MILADTSIWIDYLRGRQPAMSSLLVAEEVVMHPFVIAEIALGSLSNRHRTFVFLESLEQVHVAHLREVRHMIDAHSLYSKGIGLTDAHLIASCLITPGTKLWTRDANLHGIAAALGISAILP